MEYHNIARNIGRNKVRSHINFTKGISLVVRYMITIHTYTLEWMLVWDSTVLLMIDTVDLEIFVVENFSSTTFSDEN